ncbi:hypothetical protein D3C85_1498050 [compost metagenome]
MLRLNSCLSPLLIIEATPSLVLSATLPTKPSQTTISTVPLKMSLPSTLPKKLISPAWPALRSSSPLRLMMSLPLMASSPILSRPTEALEFSSSTDTSAVPMKANCSRCSAVQSTLAPRSSTVVARPRLLGSWAAIAGRSMPSRVLST